MKLYEGFAWTVWRYEFELPAVDGAGYGFGDHVYPVATRFDGNIRIAYCTGNNSSPLSEATTGEAKIHLWNRLAREHDTQPFHLLLRGGDQISGDEIVDSHPRTSRWRTRRVRPYNHEPFSEEMREAAESFLFERYRATYAEPTHGYLAARVPSLMMWSDHDILDGWGTIEEWRTDSPVGEGVLATARKLFLIFQMAATADEGSPPNSGRSSATLGFAAHFPGVSVVASDLKSERRPNRLMASDGWKRLADTMDSVPRGQPVLFMSGTPVLAPRSGWFKAMLPPVLKNDWQDTTHREELALMLERLVTNVTEHGIPTTVLSGSLDVASRAEMKLPGGRVLHQLVAAGISRPARPKHRRILRWLAKLGGPKHVGRRVRFLRLPKSQRFVAERGYIVVEGANGQWHASWELEGQGRTPRLELAQAVTKL